jgi:Fe-S-cluster-containing dehydrogenase component
MTALPAATEKKLGLVIDLDTCVGCQACATSCKEWNAGGYPAPLTDIEPHGADPHGPWLNRVHAYDVGEGAASRTVHFPRSCLHCEEPACVTVCPTGASYKRAEDGIVLVDPDTCIGCKLCSWACPYGAREYDYVDGVMKKCTLCVDRIYNRHLPEEDRIPACVRACPTGARHLAGGRARRLRPAARPRLQAGEQILAPAPSPHRTGSGVGPRARGRGRRRPGSGARRPAVRLDRPHAVEVARGIEAIVMRGRMQKGARATAAPHPFTGRVRDWSARRALATGSR